MKYQDAKTKARKFHLDRLDQAYNPNRLQHVGAKDAMIDPHVTIRHEIELPKKDPGYVQLLQQDTVNRDATRRVITDYSDTPIIKVDQEGGMFDMQLSQGRYMQQLLSPQPNNRADRSPKVHINPS